MIDTFACIPLSTKLTRSSCASRHERATKEKSGESTRGAAHKIGSKQCAECPIGAAHARGETPTAWADGAPIVVSVLDAGGSRLTKATDEPPQIEESEETMKCSACESSEIDNLGDGESAYCPSCGHAWIPVADHGPLGALGVTYRRARNEAAHLEALTIWIDDAPVGTLTVRDDDERTLVDLLVYALAGNGAREVESG